MKKTFFFGMIMIVHMASYAMAQNYQKNMNATTSPIGYVQFCRDNLSECDFKERKEEIIQLDRKKWDILIKINKNVNDTVEPVSDMDHHGVTEFWTYPYDKKGDCEDYALEKRKQLKEAGFPLSAMLLTVVRQVNNEGHLVLVLKTDRGDFVLDNQDSDVLIRNKTPYKYIKQQSMIQDNKWVSFNDTDNITDAYKIKKEKHDKKNSSKNNEIQTFNKTQ